MAIDVKTVIPDWTPAELSVQKFVYPIIDFWVTTTVLALVTHILRYPVWYHPDAVHKRAPGNRPPVHSGLIPYSPAPGQPVPLVSALVSPYGYPPHSAAYPQNYPQQPPAVVYYQPVGTVSELLPTPVPATRAYEADGTQQPAELQGAATLRRRSRASMLAKVQKGAWTSDYLILGRV
ncbi:hypothetical protein VTJ49DRAFT_5993 [Mycothermus thermophilus]|uniref:Uncharacterized protein n=1 Tax=Humicola insolens TaxID=85995 RepID=A0ABR3VJQ1_HUMIN